MKRKAREAFELLATLNPVSQGDRDALVAGLAPIRPDLPARPRIAARWRVRRVIVALAVGALLAIGGVAVAADWTPLATIGANDRPTQPEDALSAAAREEVGKHELLPTGMVGARLVDEARLVGALADGRKVYVLPTSKSKLCIVVGEGDESCYAPLSRDEPATFAMAKTRPGAPHVVWGVATDGVVSVSFEIGRESVTVPVRNNFYAWQGHPSASLETVSAMTATFSDGTTERVR
jgi:hypothetical protein